MIGQSGVEQLLFLDNFAGEKFGFVNPVFKYRRTYRHDSYRVGRRVKFP
jgi:hypothetical protein